MESRTAAVLKMQGILYFTYSVSFIFLLISLKGFVFFVTYSSGSPEARTISSQCKKYGDKEHLFNFLRKVGV